MDDGGATPDQIPGPELVGQVLAGRYRIVEMLGEGAMGAVYLAEHLKIGRRDAIKVLRPSLSKDPESIARFTRGARNASRVRHPNVCSIYDFGETEGGVAFLAMEYIDGESLQDLLQREGHLSVEECVHLMRQTAEALQAAHEAGIIHRDLKPGNIMLTRGRGGRRVVKVVDFDIAKGSSEGQSSDLTQLGLVIGTPEYMSPEQLTADALDGRSDVYSLGMVLFRMLTGVLPFAARTTREVMLQRLTATPGTLAGAAPDRDFPPGLQSVLDRALARSPEERFPDADAFARALKEAVEGRGVLAPPPFSPPPAVGTAGAGRATPGTRPAEGRPPPLAGPQSSREQPFSPAPPRPAPTQPARQSVPGTREIAAVAPGGRRWVLPALLGTLAVAVVAAVLALGSGDVAELDLLPPQAVLRGGERIQITAAVSGSVGEEAREEGFSWISSNPSVATVDAQGVVTGVGEGTAAIVARIGELTASADITVGGTPGPGVESDRGQGAERPGSGPRTGGGGATPALAVGRTRVSLGSVEGEGVEPTAVEVTGQGITNLAVAVAYPSGGSSGWLSADLSGVSAPARVELRVDPEAVPVGEHEARVDVSASGGPAATIRVFYVKDPAGSGGGTGTDAGPGLPPGDLGLILDRQERLLEELSPAAFAAVSDTARSVWTLSEASEELRARAAFYVAQAEFGAGNTTEARVWAERAVELAPSNDGYRRLLDQLIGGAP